MAIDTATKRISALRVANPMVRTLPVPDGTIAAADRVHLLGGYGGLFNAGATIITPSARNALGPDTTTRYLGPDSTHRYLGPD